MSDEVSCEWPDWPEAEIAEWLAVQKGVRVRYRLTPIGHVVWIHRATGTDGATEDDPVLPWPERPTADLAAHLQLNHGDIVLYGPSTGRLVAMVKQSTGEASKRPGTWDEFADETIGVFWRGQLAGDPTTTNSVECAGCGFENTFDGQVQGRPNCQNPEPPVHKLHDKPASD